ncbi:MAG: hypothetical protein HY908_35460 [Myxococcales bacterium]|nr:hypothetical protein [Myxococcales bacterium]
MNGWLQRSGALLRIALLVAPGLGLSACPGPRPEADPSIGANPLCGDGVLDSAAGETCDDGNHDNTDACPDGDGGTCQPATCGDGLVWSTDGGTEPCDGDGAGVAGETPACDDDCTAVVCGDGNANAAAGEGCDDGNQDNTDACPDGANGTCEAATCGDGFVWTQGGGTEGCDDGDADDTDSCPTTCATATCGDGFVWSTDGGTEDCDDQNGVTGDGCGDCRRVVRLDVGGDHACALLSDGHLKCWGGNSSGQLGLGDTQSRGDAANEMGAGLPVVDLGTGKRATAVAAGDYHTCAVLDDGRVKCWGGGASGATGLGGIADIGDDPGEMGDNLATVSLGTGRTAIDIDAGLEFTCALLDNHSVKCWGGNFSGELGLGDANDRGDAPGEMGDSLPAANFGGGHTVASIAVGHGHACAILDDSTVRCWGGNAFGQLGLGDTANRGDGAGEMAANLPGVSLGTGRTAVQLSAGRNHTCAILDDATLKCWGGNAYGALGQGDSSPRGDAPGEMGDNLPTVPLATGRTPAFVSAGWYHTCVGLDNGAVKCWGYNSSGELGLGDTTTWGDDPNEAGDNLPFVALGTGRTAVGLAATASGRSCALLDDATVKCWGNNASGQLGLGDVTQRGDGPNEMGDALPTLLLP